ncbi:TIGR01244 family phosphatase [Pusillimonas sp. CC-YST705]|uniref:TIGR01244 family phosphatase n=1 Tax=Mesopusillimonas faecipullorum TaxID=2755040 RepID=A0ABS8CCE4_9BURK|nr:TIGR01244 family sulfur transferase [Mesopusillimonas faecipullorum]MCB5363512.1 TIGR01244 family phosphatase [Mesopusillimonas faecipullorum]
MSVPLNRLSEGLAVAPQLAPQDMAAVAQAGYRSVIINRPDNEGGAEQPTSEQVMQAAREAGLQVAYQPVVSGAMTLEDVQRFKQLLEELPAPVLAYCRSGTRCTNLYRASQQI